MVERCWSRPWSGVWTEARERGFGSDRRFAFTIEREPRSYSTYKALGVRTLALAPCSVLSSRSRPLSCLLPACTFFAVAVCTTLHPSTSTNIPIFTCKRLPPLALAAARPHSTPARLPAPASFVEHSTSILGIVVLYVRFNPTTCTPLSYGIFPSIFPFIFHLFLRFFSSSSSASMHPPSVLFFVCKRKRRLKGVHCTNCTNCTVRR